MPMLRVDDLLYVTGVFPEAALTAGIPALDSMAGHKVAIDEARLLQGVGLTSEVGDGSLLRHYACLDYGELKLLARRLSTRRDPKVGGGGADVAFLASTQLAQVRSMLRDVITSLAAFLIFPNEAPEGVDGGWGVGVYPVPYRYTWGSEES